MSFNSQLGCRRFMEAVPLSLDLELTAVERKSFEDHERDCEDCGSYLREVRTTIGILRALGSEREPKRDEFDESIKSLFRSWKSGDVLIPRDHSSDRLDEALEEMIGRSEVEKSEFLNRTHLGNSLALKNAAVARTLELGRQDPQLAREMGELAVFLCDDDGCQDLGEEVRIQANLMRALAKAALANAMRICSDFFGASRLFHEAEAILGDQHSDSLERARIELLKAHLFADCQQFERARESLECAGEIYRDKQKPHMEGRTVIALGSMLGRFGSPELAVDLLRKGILLIDSTREPRLTLVARHNLVHYLFDSGQHLEAMELLPETRALHEELGNAVDLARLTWLEGQIALEQGELKAAEASFDQVRNFFVDKGVPLDAAGVSLDLATVYLKQNRLAELKALSVEMLTIFDGIGAQKECQAALSFFERAIELEKAQMEIVCDLLEYLRAVRLDKKLEARLSFPT